MTAAAPAHAADRSELGRSTTEAASACREHQAAQFHRFKEAGIHSIQLALIGEAKKRAGRSFEDWSLAEARAVWSATRDFAQQHGLRVPTLAEVQRVELLACGHSDYGSKWALYAIELTFRH